jgi:hypothetical protein
VRIPSAEEILKEAKTARRSTAMNARLRERLDIGGYKMEWSMAGNTTGYLYFDQIWEFAPFSKPNLDDVTLDDFQTVFASEGESEQIRSFFQWPYPNQEPKRAINVKEGQIVFARLRENPSTVYVIQLLNQVCEGSPSGETSKESIMADYFSYPLN